MRRSAAIAVCLAAAAAAVVVFSPALKLDLTSDDYQWAQLAHRALHQPRALLEDLDGFYRPTATWTMALDLAVWHHDPSGFHLTNLLLHAASAGLLVAVCLSLGLSPPAALAVGTLWACSPFTAEPAYSVSSRHETLLLISWLVMILAWPRPGQGWRRAQLAVVVAATAFAALSKETWVVTPLLALALELGARRRSWGEALRTTTPFAGAVTVYTVAHLLLLPGRSYFQLDPALLAKVPHMLAAFLQLESLVPLAFPLTLKGLLALTFFAGAAAYGLRHRPVLALAGFALLGAALPTLLIGTLPTRYTTIPYAGFLLVAAAALGGFRDRLAPAGRRLLVGATSIIVALVLAAGILTVRADLADVDRVSDATRTLLAEAEAAAPSLPTDRPFLLARQESTNPLREIALSPRGLAKIYFVRHQDPYGLVDSAALFEWVLGPGDLAVRSLSLKSTSGEPTGPVLVHVDGGFRWMPAPAPNLAAAASILAASGLRVKLLEVVALDG